MLKYDDAHVHFKSSFKALMEHVSLKRLSVQAMRRVKNSTNLNKKGNKNAFVFIVLHNKATCLLF